MILNKVTINILKDREVTKMTELDTKIVSYFLTLIKRTVLKTSLCLLLSIGLSSSFVLASSGNDPYTPTKLEWLAVEVASKSKINNPEWLIRVSPHPPNTINVSALYSNDANLSDLDAALAFIKMDVDMSSVGMGFTPIVKMSKKLNPQFHQKKNK